jgi:thiol-disulfide isomerase/thioredoxin
MQRFKWVLLAVLVSMLGACDKSSSHSSAAQKESFDEWERVAATVPPELVLKDIEGKTHRLQDYAGKTVIVNFWATWCPSCVDEIPSLEALRASSQPDKLVILTISDEDDLKTITRFMQKKALKLTVLRDVENEATQDWEITAIPTSFVISPNQRVQFKAVGGVDFKSDEMNKVLQIASK